MDGETNELQWDGFEEDERLEGEESSGVVLCIEALVPLVVLMKNRVCVESRCDGCRRFG
jgi:hypothetical protein